MVKGSQLAKNDKSLKIDFWQTKHLPAIKFKEFLVYKVQLLTIYIFKGADFRGSSVESQANKSFGRFV